MDKNSKGIYKEPDTSPSVPKGKNHVLAIAIDDYKYCNKLNNAVKDAQDFVALLMDKYGFDEKHIQFLSNEEATAERVIDTLKWLMKNVKPTDNVLIYFSGHGEFDKDFDEGFWIPVEAKSGQSNQYIPNFRINKALEQINSFHTFLIVDSCYSGSLFLDGKSKSLSESYDFPSRWGLTSGRNTIVSDGAAGTNSPFAAALLDVLRRIDKPMNVSALCDLIKQTVPAVTNKLQIPIGDPLSINGHKGGQFVFEPLVKISPEETAFWQDATAKNSLLAYYHYLRKYPNGQYALEADARLDALENQEFIEKQERVEAEKVRKVQIVQQVAEKRERERQEKARLAELENERKKQAETAKKEPQKKALLAKKEPEMVLVKGGTFEMGSDKDDDEKPIHAVTLSDFLIGKYPLTITQFLEFIKDTNYKTDAEKEDGSYIWTDSKWKKQAGVSWRCDVNGNAHPQTSYNHPVTHVSWNDAKAYIDWLAKKTGKKYRLPTEAEWEFAARGGNKPNGFEFSGSNNIDDVAWYWENSGKKTHSVGTKKANELGIHDMSGNIWEWCSDWYDSYRNAIENNPTGVETGSHRVFRGGSWVNDAEFCRVAYRNCNSPAYRDYDLGFRLVSSLQ